MEIGITDSQAVWLQRMPNQESQGEFVSILHCECLFETKVYPVDYIFYDIYEALQNIPKIRSGLLNNSTQLSS